MDNTSKVIDLQAFRLASRRTPDAEPGSEARVLRPSFDGSGRTQLGHEEAGFTAVFEAIQRVMRADA